mmetsp:Transcript_52091/g.158193  ORF Transcript_52091/g.158193 Transcript_52091/m.158193 type:complete len:298 (+) Transcript_52091:1900-2793(+)
MPMHTASMGTKNSSGLGSHASTVGGAPWASSSAQRSGRWRSSGMDSRTKDTVLTMIVRITKNAMAFPPLDASASSNRTKQRRRNPPSESKGNQLNCPGNSSSSSSGPDFSSQSETDFTASSGLHTVSNESVFPISLDTDGRNVPVLDLSCVTISSRNAFTTVWASLSSSRPDRSWVLPRASRKRPQSSASPVGSRGPNAWSSGPTAVADETLPCTCSLTKGLSSTWPGSSGGSSFGAWRLRPCGLSSLLSAPSPTPVARSASLFPLGVVLRGVVTGVAPLPFLLLAGFVWCDKIMAP